MIDKKEKYWKYEKIIKCNTIRVSPSKRDNDWPCVKYLPYFESFNFLEQSLIFHLSLWTICSNSRQMSSGHILVNVDSVKFM